MKRWQWVALWATFLFAALSAQGQNLSQKQWNDLSKFLHPLQTQQIMFSDAGTFGSDPDLTWDKTGNVLRVGAGANFVKLNDDVPNDNSQHFFEVVGTLPSSPSTDVQGIVANVTSAGSAAHGQEGGLFNLLAGYTGATYTQALAGLNAAAGTGTSFFTSGNSGTVGISFATTAGTNVGVSGSGQGGNLNIGTAGLATTNKNGATNVGVVGLGRNSGTTPIEVGVYAGLNTSNPTFESAALVADNAAVAAPIFLARDNGATVFSVQDAGSVQCKMATKTLTESTDTAFVRVAVAQSTTVGGHVFYTIEANDATDFQIISGVQPFGAINKAGTESVGLGTPATSTEVTVSPVGTLTNTFTFATGTDTFDIRANAVSSLTQTILRINYCVTMYSFAMVAVTPQ